MKVIKALFVVAALTALTFVLFYVWPTQWRDLPLKTIGDGQFHQRQNRFTGQVGTWIPAEIDKIGGRYVGGQAGTWTKDF